MSAIENGGVKENEGKEKKTEVHESAENGVEILRGAKEAIKESGIVLEDADKTLQADTTSNPKERQVVAQKSAWLKRLVGRLALLTAATQMHADTPVRHLIPDRGTLVVENNENNGPQNVEKESPAEEEDVVPSSVEKDIYGSQKILAKEVTDAIADVLKNPNKPLDPEDDTFLFQERMAKENKEMEERRAFAKSIAESEIHSFLEETKGKNLSDADIRHELMERFRAQCPADQSAGCNVYQVRDEAHTFLQEEAKKLMKTDPKQAYALVRSLERPTAFQDDRSANGFSGMDVAVEARSPELFGNYLQSVIDVAPNMGGEVRESALMERTLEGKWDQTQQVFDGLDTKNQERVREAAKVSEQNLEFDLKNLKEAVSSLERGSDQGVYDAEIKSAQQQLDAVKKILGNG